MSALVDGELSPGECSQFEDHIGQCEDCAELRDRFEAQGRVLQLLPPSPHPQMAEPGFWSPMDEALSGELDQLEARALEPGVQEARSWGERRFSVPLPAILAYAGALALAIWWGWSHSDADSSQALEAASPTTSVPVESSPAAEPKVADGPSGRLPVVESGESPVREQEPRVRVPPELVRPAAYRPHRGIF